MIEHASPPAFHDGPARNACRLCAPLGAAMVFKGVARCVPLLHGSQGCATYIRRYMISHFREPVDIASSSFSESDAIYGGAETLLAGVRNVDAQYKPDLIGVATTCLAETIGEDVDRVLFPPEGIGVKAALATASTPSYSGSHVDGFHKAVRALAERLCAPSASDRARGTVNLFPNMLSPEDLRHIKELLEAFRLPATILPDYSDTLDGTPWEECSLLPDGGTPLDAIRAMGGAMASVELGATLAGSPKTAAAFLSDRFGVPRFPLGIPIGVRETDAFVSVLSRLSERRVPAVLSNERGRLVDALIDGHKVLQGRRCVLFGDPDLVVGLASLLCEAGALPAVIASGSRSEHFEREIRRVTDGFEDVSPEILNGADHERVAESAAAAAPSFIVGSSKGFPAARKLGVPLVRVGFPVHDRFGGQRTLHVGYRGALRLYDTIVNTLIEKAQESNPAGYMYY